MSGSIQSNAPEVAGFDFSPSESSQGAVSTEGRYRGERVVQLAQVTSPLQDGMDIPVSDDQDTPLSGRRIEKDGRKEQGTAVTSIKEVLNKLDDLRKSVLERLLHILMLRQFADATALRAAVREQLPEPAHQYAALLAMVEQLREQGAPEARMQMALEALRQLEHDQGPAIRAALNISEVAGQFAHDRLGDVPALRQTYRDAVLDRPNLSQTFAALVDQYGERELPHAIAYLVKALGADLAAEGSSIDRNKLQLVLNDLYRLELLTGLLEDCQHLLERYPPAEGDRRQGSALLKEVLDLQQSNWVRSDQISPLPAKLGVRELTDEIQFLREFKELARLIPLKVYTDTEQRPRLLEAIQQALDATIAREEELEEHG